MEDIDKYIIICSDGVFEFLTSQAVVDIVAKHDDPSEAAHVLVSEAYKLWLQYEVRFAVYIYFQQSQLCHLEPIVKVRTDDITAIVIKISGMDSKSPNPIYRQKGSAEVIEGGEHIALNINRPVRRMMSREKRSIIAIHNEKEDDLGPLMMKKDKTPMEIAKIECAVESNFLFQHLNKEQKKLVFNQMGVKKVKPNDVIIQQGDKVHEKITCFVVFPSIEIRLCFICIVG